MALAVVSGLAPIYGLYSAFVPLLIFPLFTSSRQVSMGATATSSILIAASLSGRVPDGSDQYANLGMVFLHEHNMLRYLKTTNWCHNQ